MFSGENIPIDLNNPKNVWNINKFCENKSQYLEYHAKVAFAFKQDCENLLLAFTARKDLSFKAFAEVWQQLSFSLVFVGQDFFDELPVFAESCFFIIKKYIMFSSNINIQVGAVYLLYGIYGKQPSKDVVPIRMTAEERLALLKLVENIKSIPNTEDFTYIFGYLQYHDAFQMVATTRCLGLEPKFTWQEKKMKNNIFHNTAESNPTTMLEKVLFSDKSYSLNNLNDVCQGYDDAMKEYTTSTSGKPLAIHMKSRVVQTVEDLFKDLQKELEQPDVISDGRAVALKKKAIRDKAYQTMTKDKSKNSMVA